MKLSDEEINQLVEHYNQNEFTQFAQKLLQKSIFDELDHERKLSYPETIGDVLSGFHKLGFVMNKENIIQMTQFLMSGLNKK